MIERYLSDQDGIIVVRSTGRWTKKELDDHFSALKRILDSRRSAGEPVRILSDLTDAAEQDEWTGPYILNQFRQTYLPTDRVALLLKDCDVKLMVRGMLVDFEIAAFNSRLPAEMWLMTEELPPPR